MIKMNFGFQNQNMPKCLRKNRLERSILLKTSGRLMVNGNEWRKNNICKMACA